MDDAAEAEVEVVAAQGSQPGGQPVHLLVALEGGGAVTHRGPSHLRQALLEVGDRPLEPGGDPGEVLPVAVDQGRVGLGREGAGKSERSDVVGSVVGSVVVVVLLRHAVQCEG